MQSNITLDDLAKFAAAFDADPKNRLAANAVAQNDIAAVALNRESVNRINHTYSHLIETPEATDQGATGRCWMFAGLNVMRLAAIQKMNLKMEKFELSQAYLMYWDKLEKANFFLENIIETRDEPLDGRLVMWLLADPLPDAGQWDMFVSLVKKYGVIPKTMMPETKSSSASRLMNSRLVAKLREFAQTLRDTSTQGVDVDGLRETKAAMLTDFHRMLTIHFGKPPASFEWAWRDKDKAYHLHGVITPLDFYAEYVGIDLDDMVCLINAPTQDKPYNKLYTVAYLGNVVGGQPVRYLNADVKILKKAAVDSIVDGQAVWFGSDVGQMLERDLGLLDMDVYDYELVYGVPFALDKAGRLDYGHSRMTHAMLLTGVDLDETGRPVKWRVENSWGTKRGDEGYMLMTDRWFEEYLYEIAVSKRYLSPDLLAVLETEPVVLPPWDPMGALAR
ncbi:MAG: C1 family peptidase [Anaerolineae bacterium]